MTLFLCLVTIETPLYKLFSDKSRTDHNQRGNYLGFLPQKKYSTRASSEDLLLVSNSSRCEDPSAGALEWMDDYCICNPFTREWLELAKPPMKGKYSTLGLEFEFKNNGDKFSNNNIILRASPPLITVINQLQSLKRNFWSKIVFNLNFYIGCIQFKFIFLINTIWICDKELFRKLKKKKNCE